MTNLKDQPVVPASSDIEPLSDEKMKELLEQVPEWRIRHSSENDLYFLTRDFTFDSYLDGVKFHNTVAETAEEVQHHPELITHYQKVSVKWWTHTVGGIHVNDFILAAKCDDIYGR